MSSVQQLWNIPRFLELKTCFNSKNITVSDPAANMTKEIQVSPTQLNIAVKVRSPLCCPNLTFIACTVPLLFRNQNMPHTQRIPSNLSPPYTREQFKDQNQRYRCCVPRNWEWRSPTHATTSSSPTLWPCSSSPSSSSPCLTSASLRPSRFKVFIQPARWER